MSIVKNTLLILKSEESSSKNINYKDFLESHGYAVKFMQVLDFRFTEKNIDELCDKLENIQDYSGIIFTSPRGIQATQIALSRTSKVILDTMKNLDNYVIGDSTKQLAKDLIGLDCRGSETGNAVNLAQLIIREKSKYTKPFLVPCGSMKRDVLSSTLKTANIICDTQIVYETIPSEDLESSFRSVTNNCNAIPEYWIYFSPSGVKFTQSIRDLSEKSEIKFISIGPATTEELEKYKLTVTAAAEKPNPESLLLAIQYAFGQ